jgi:hypothetical protein
MPRSGENIGHAYVLIHGDGDGLRGDVKESIKEGLKDSDKDVDEAGERHSDSYMKKWDERMERLGKRIDDIGERSGRLFGQGSRNNFLNFLGSSINNSVKLIGLLPKLGSGLIKIGQNISEAFTESGGGLSGTLAAVGTLGPMLLKGGAALATFAVALPVIVAMLAVMASLLTAIVGTLIALAGSVIYAAIAGVFALAGAFGVLAAGIGVVAIGISQMSDAQKKMVKEATEPLVDAFKELGRASARGLFTNIEEQAKRLTPILAAFEPMFYKIGRAVSRVGDSIVDSLDSPEFAHFRKQMEVFLPNAVRTLGETINNIFGGLGGVFLAMRPFIRDFLNDLEGVTQEFSDWANSKDGRKEIRQFLEDAAESAEEVGNFLVKVVDLFATLFDLGGTDAGNSMFESMSENIEHFITYLEDNPDAVKDFFKDAEEVAQDIGDIIVKVGELIGALDDLLGHPLLTGALDILIGGLDLLLLGFEKLPFVVSPLGFILSKLEGIGGALDVVGQEAEEFGDLVSESFRQLPGIVTSTIGKIPGLVRRGLGGLGSIATSAIGRMLAPFASFVGRAMNHISNLPDRVRSLVGRIPGMITSVVARMISPFVGISGKIIDHVNDLPQKIRDLFHKVVDFVQGIPGRIVGLFSGLAGKILKAIGTIDIGSLIKIPDPGGGVPFVPGVASGGVFGQITNGPMLRWVGEDGPEAIVPLSRDLSRVDPSVRALSAFAQGKSLAGGGTTPQGKTIDASGWQIVSNNEDAGAVAQEVVNRLFAAQF